MNNEQQSGAVVWLTGLSGAGKSTIADAVADRLTELGRKIELLDGDVVRTHLSKGLSFSKEDRDLNVRRIGWVANLVARHGGIAITAAISPYRAIRDEVRQQIEADGNVFLEVFVDTPLEECIRRDVKGLYKRALAGEIQSFTGVSDPYEPPANPELTIQTTGRDAGACADEVVNALRERGVVGAAALA